MKKTATKEEVFEMIDECRYIIKRIKYYSEYVSPIIWSRNYNINIDENSVIGTNNADYCDSILLYLKDAKAKIQNNDKRVTLQSVYDNIFYSLENRLRITLKLNKRNHYHNKLEEAWEANNESAITKFQRLLRSVS